MVVLLGTYSTTVGITSAADCTSCALGTLVLFPYLLSVCVRLCFCSSVFGGSFSLRTYCFFMVAHTQAHTIHPNQPCPYGYTCVDPNPHCAPRETPTISDSDAHSDNRITRLVCFQFMIVGCTPCATGTAYRCRRVFAKLARAATCSNSTTRPLRTRHLFATAQTECQHAGSIPIRSSMRRRRAGVCEGAGVLYTRRVQHLVWVRVFRCFVLWFCYAVSLSLCVMYASSCVAFACAIARRIESVTPSSGPRQGHSCHLTGVALVLNATDRRGAAQQLPPALLFRNAIVCVTAVGERAVKAHSVHPWTEGGCIRRRILHTSQCCLLCIVCCLFVADHFFDSAKCHRR